MACWWNWSRPSTRSFELVEPLEAAVELAQERVALLQVFEREVALEGQAADAEAAVCRPDRRRPSMTNGLYPVPR